MAVYNVYAPVGGSSISTNCYCNRRTYNPCQANCPSISQTQYPRCMDQANCTTCTSPCFCSSCCYHVVVGQASGYCCPLDISCASGSVIAFHGSNSIKSITIKFSGGICGSVTCGQAGMNDIGCGIKVGIYSSLNAMGYIGTLHYAHLYDRSVYVSDGQIINQPQNSQWTRYLGKAPAIPAGQSCYLSGHVHMSIQGNGKARAALACNGPVYYGTTQIYSWTV